MSWDSARCCIAAVTPAPRPSLHRLGCTWAPSPSLCAACRRVRVARTLSLVASPVGPHQWALCAPPSPSIPIHPHPSLVSPYLDPALGSRPRIPPSDPALGVRPGIPPSDPGLRSRPPIPPSDPTSDPTFGSCPPTTLLDPASDPTLGSRPRIPPLTSGRNPSDPDAQDVPWISYYMFSHHLALLIADELYRRSPPSPPPRWPSLCLLAATRASLLAVIASASVLAFADRTGLVHGVCLGIRMGSGRAGSHSIPDPPHRRRSPYGDLAADIHWL